MNLAETIKKTEVMLGSIVFFFLGQAGFCFKFSNGKTFYLDAYLSDSCYRLFGFKRMPVMTNNNENIGYIVL